MDGQLRGKVVLVTCSSIGIGRATALGFAREGCRSVVTYYQDRGEAERTASRCRGLGATDVLLTELNVKDDGSIKRAVQKVLDQHGGLDILMMNVTDLPPLAPEPGEELRVTSANGR